MLRTGNNLYNILKLTIPKIEKLPDNQIKTFIFTIEKNFMALYKQDHKSLSRNNEYIIETIWVKTKPELMFMINLIFHDIIKYTNRIKFTQDQLYFFKNILLLMYKEAMNLYEQQQIS